MVISAGLWILIFRASVSTLLAYAVLLTACVLNPLLLLSLVTG